jgi:hypothetical protein
MSKLLINEPPLQVLPTLATKIGLGKAIILQQVHYWCENPKIGVSCDEKKWIRNTAEDWQKDNFPFWSLKTVKRTIAALEEDGILLSRSDLNKSGYDRTKWYSINYEALENGTASKPDEPEPDDPIDPIWVDALGHNDPMERVIMTRSLSESTAETTKEATASRPAAQDELALAAPSDSPTSSPRTEKKSGTKKAKPTFIAPDANNYHREMFAALAALCKVDQSIKRGQLNAMAKTLLNAGYKPADLDKFSGWWYSQDFRGQQGKPPTIAIVGELILQAVQWVPWTPPVAQTKKSGYTIEALRSWHIQFHYEKWTDGFAATLGHHPYDQSAFDDWYKSQCVIPDEELDNWYSMREYANK